MLYLHPPYHVIDGVSLMPDHEDPLQFYYLPLAPHLTLVTDPATGQRIPQLQLLEYAGMATTPGEPVPVTGGFLNFDCNLGIEPDVLPRIAAKLQGKAGLRELPRLSPVPLVDGSVRMMLLGAQTPDPAAPKPPAGTPAPPPGTPQFVVKINHAAKPSLYGDNQACFSVQLDQSGATLMRAALQGEMSPIGVVYELAFLGLRPAYNVRVTADWNRVQTHLESSFKTNLLVFSSQIDEVVDKLVEDKVILIEGTLEVAEGDGSTGGEAARYEQALTDVKEMVTGTFFEPSLDPMASERGSTLDTFERISQTLATGGHGSMFSYRSADLTRIDQKSINVTMSERTAVIRRIYPQGHLAGLSRVIEEQGLDLERFMMRVSLEDDFYKRRTLRVIPRADWTQDHIESIAVTLDYGGDVRTLVFDAAHAAEQTVDWASILEDGSMRRPVSCRYEVGFASSVGAGRPEKLVSGELPLIEGDAIEISPRRDDLYDVMRVPINLIDAKWDLYPTVEVSCRYQDAENGIDIEDAFAFNQATAAAGSTWPLFLVDPTRRTFSHRVVFHGADGRTVDKGWVESEEGQIRVADPFPRRRSLQVVVPSGLFETGGLDQAFVSVRYEDPANAVAKEQQLSFTKADAAGKTFSVELVNPELRDVHFQAKLLYSNGYVAEIPPSTTAEDVLILREGLRGHRAVTIVADGDFAALGLREVLVDASYADTTAQLSYTDKILLTPGATRGRFEYEYVDAAKDSFSYVVTQRFSNGMEKRAEPVVSDATEIRVAVG